MLALMEEYHFNLIDKRCLIKNLKVSDLGEDLFYREGHKGLIAYKDVVIGAGDDCAVIKTSDKKISTLKTDSVVEGVHYLSSDSPIAVGYKAMARAMSDIAAMGGTLKTMR